MSFATACTLLLALAPPTKPRSRPLVLSRRQLLPTLGAAAAAASAAAPRPASAAFGPAGAAVTSVPDVLRINVEEWLALPADKALQRIGTLSVERLQVVSEELETALADASSSTLGDLIKRLEDDVADYNSTSTYAELQRARERAERAKAAVVLSRQLREQEKLLQLLDAQPPWVVYGAAALASMGSTLVMHPIDTLKTRQIAGAAGADGDARSAAAPARAAAAAVAAEPEPLSIGELYVGLLPNIVKEAPASALYLGIYELAKGLLLQGGLAATPLLAYLLAGAAGEVVGSLIRAPAEAIKSRLQSGADSTTVDSVRSVLGTSAGRENVMRAWSSSLWRDVPFGAIQLAVFEGLKTYIINSPDIVVDVDTLFAEALFGATGGAIGAFLTTPTDVVTIRILTQGTGVDEACDEQGCTLPLGFVGMAKEVYAQSGARGFLQGARARTVYWAPAIGIFLSCYCSIRQAAVTSSLFG
mmetsp:Transcript_38567/g.121087  ORF Transcript_38567/g.121087 Transcript_38567/m.121087 type:complete len:474 (+) Transcript_38567:17-1438(+)